MKKLIIAGFGQPIIDLYNVLKNKFHISGVILDYERKQKFPSFYEFLSQENLKTYSFEEAQILQPDVILVINYNKIIDVSTINIPFLLNIHLGLLPTYRGNNANSWSILNGDRNIGYTIHRVNEVLDGGDIFYKFGYEIKENETYNEAKKAINDDLFSKLDSVLGDIISGKLQAVSQKDEAFVYCSKLIPEDGIITNWNCDTESIFNRYIIFAKPLGTGLKMKYNDKIIDIHKISSIPNFKKSNGYPGAVVLKNTDGSVWIKTKDTAISLDEIIVDDHIVRPADFFKTNERL